MLGLDRTYRHLQVHGIVAEVHHDRQHGHRSERDTAGKEEEEDQTADEEAEHHGDEHIQLPEIKKTQNNRLLHTLTLTGLSHLT